MYKFKTIIKDVPSLCNRHEHWSKASKERKKWHILVFHAFKNDLPKVPIKKVEINVVRFSSRMPDYDNLVYSFKPVFDGLILAKVIEDDSMNVVIKRDYKWVRTKEIERHITIEVIEHE